MTTHTQHERPALYLENGLLDSHGQLRPGMNGERSLGLAYLLREEGLTARELTEIRERIAGTVESFVPSGSDLGSIDLPEDARAALRRTAEQLERESPLVAEVITAAEPHLRRWTCVAHMFGHLERANAQLALIESATAGDSS